jgi:hypothetical protein
MVASFFASKGDLIIEAVKLFSGNYGKPDFISDVLPFDYTDYYRAEMGSPLVRRFASFENLISPETLPEIKSFANDIEDRFSAGGKRGVNIDPGYLSEFHLILATGKGYAHRPYLRDGIYADLTLIYRNNAFHPLEWTYPDYASSDITRILIKIRDKYVFQLRNQKSVNDDGSLFMEL